MIRSVVVLLRQRAPLTVRLWAVGYRLVWAVLPCRHDPVVRVTADGREAFCPRCGTWRHAGDPDRTLRSMYP